MSGSASFFSGGLQEIIFYAEIVGYSVPALAVAGYWAVRLYLSYLRGK